MAGSFTPGRKSNTPEGDKNFWGTQWSCFHDAQELFGRPFQFDVAAEATTAKCGPVDYFSPERGDDALELNWPADWWCNPPFDLKVEFIQKALEQMREGRPGMMLLPYEPLTGWWQDNLKDDVVVYEPDGRYNFLERDGETVKSGVNFGSAFVMFGGFAVGRSIRIPFERGIAALRQAEREAALQDELI